LDGRITPMVSSASSDSTLSPYGRPATPPVRTDGFRADHEDTEFTKRFIKKTKKKRRALRVVVFVACADGPPSARIQGGEHPGTSTGC
jgi:hypothetical protein